MVLRIFRRYEDGVWRDPIEFQRILKLDFAPQADVIGETLPINQFTVQIVTTVDLSKYVNHRAILLGSDAAVWAAYTIVDVRSVYDNVVQIMAQSVIALIDKKRMSAAIVSTTAGDVVESIFGAISYNMAVELANIPINGVFPEQSARERLRDLCLVIGAYVSTSFNLRPEILPLEESGISLPKEITYCDTKVSCKDYVTTVTVKYYSYVEGTPSTTQKYVEINGTTYIETVDELSATNINVPRYVPDKEVVISGVKIINSTNVSEVLERVAEYYFNRINVDCGVLDTNGRLHAGSKVSVFTSARQMHTGYIEQVTYRFGTQAQARLRISMCEAMDTHMLVINYIWGDRRIARQTFDFPEGYVYSLSTIYVDRNIDGHRIVFRPHIDIVTGTMPATRKTETVEASPALDEYEDVLLIISVDDFEVNEGVVNID